MGKDEFTLGFFLVGSAQMELLLTWYRIIWYQLP